MRFLRIILVIFVCILLIASIFILLFGGSKTKTTTSSTTTTTEPAGLAGASNGSATVSFLLDGVINGDDMHRQINITVSKNSRTLTIIQGYQGNVLSTYSYVNNQSAYESFLNALNTAGFTKERDNPTTTSVSGQCPLGYRYIYSSTGIQGIPNNLWTTTCGPKSGTFGGNAGTVNQLFQAQIPNYSTLVSQVKLN
jgi:hypothetical protein